MNITLKNVPEAVYEVMKSEAKRNRRSLNSQIIHALEKEAEEAERRDRLARMRKEMDKLAESIGSMPDSTPLIRRERDRR